MLAPLALAQLHLRGAIRQEAFAEDLDHGWLRCHRGRDRSPDFALVGASSRVVAFAPGLLLIGLGLGVMLTPSVNVVQSSFPRSFRARSRAVTRCVESRVVFRRRDSRHDPRLRSRLGKRDLHRGNAHPCGPRPDRSRSRDAAARRSRAAGNRSASSLHVSAFAPHGLRSTRLRCPGGERRGAHAAPSKSETPPSGRIDLIPTGGPSRTCPHPHSTSYRRCAIRKLAPLPC
jgi:hypothetical protein